LRHELAALAFTPDRLAVVKGGPLVRRTYVDRLLGRLSPTAADLPSEYGRVLSQRNAGLRRVRSGLSSREAVAPWTAQLARLGSELDAARAAAVAELAPGFAAHGGTLGLPSPALRYDERGLAPEELEARLERDLERGTTGVGPHLRDVEVLVRRRDLRSFGSQGEQRAAVLALVLAEADLLAGRRGEPPLLLLDDVLSELDRTRRAALFAVLPSGGQIVITATSADALPASAPAPALVLAVTPGEARAA
jgi:DNA replication and repair protein RecF